MDSGNFSDNPTASGDTKTATLIEAMNQLGYQAANVGERDLKSGQDRLAQHAAQAEFTLVSANIVDEQTKLPVFAPHAVVEVRAADGDKKLRVGVIGVTRFNPLFRRPGLDGATLEIVRPAERIANQVQQLKSQNVDLIVLLAAMHRDDARRALQEISGVDYVIGSYGGVADTRKDEASGTWLLYSGNQGKRLGESRIHLAAAGEETGQESTHVLHYLTARYPSDPQMAAFVQHGGSTQANPATPSPAAASDYVGSGRCRHCHADAYGQWAATAHASSYVTLQREESHLKTDCLSCHTTAPGVPGGFESVHKTPAMAAVSCETCHGPGREHAASPGRNYGQVDLSTCTTCHDAANSPEFDYYSYLDRVVHTDRGAR